jgi:hypothetical protein
VVRAARRAPSESGRAKKLRDSTRAKFVGLVTVSMAWFYTAKDAFLVAPGPDRGGFLYPFVIEEQVGEMGCARRGHPTQPARAIPDVGPTIEAQVAAVEIAILRLRERRTDLTAVKYDFGRGSPKGRVHPV